MAADGLFIPIYCNLWEHPDFKDLQIELQINEVKALYHLTRLWTYCVQYYQDGNLPKNSSRIADCAKWDGDPIKFVTQLVNKNWLDPIEEGYHIHNWEKYAGKLLIKKEKDVERKRKERNKVQEEEDSVRGMSMDCPWNVHGLSVECPRLEVEVEEELELERETEEKKNICPSDGLMDVSVPEKKDKKSKPSPKELQGQAEQIYQLYPKKVGHKKAIEKIVIALRDVTFEKLLDSVREYAECPRVSYYRSQGKMDYIPNPETWFNQQRWMDDRAAWQAPETKPTPPSPEQEKQIRIERFRQQIVEARRKGRTNRDIRNSILGNWLPEDVRAHFPEVLDSS